MNRVGKVVFVWQSNPTSQETGIPFGSKAHSPYLQMQQILPKYLHLKTQPNNHTEN